MSDSLKAMRRRPTQKEVAARAGVSQAVVSEVLNGRVGAIRMQPETRARVLQAMRDLGYRPNAAARSLAGGQNRILGVFTYEPVFPTDTRDFYYPFLEGIEHEAAALGYDLLLHTRAPSLAGEAGRQRQLYEAGQTRLELADGTLLLGDPDQARRQELARLLDEGHPAVSIGRRELPDRALPFVAADYAVATEHALNELLARGHRRVLYLGGLSHHESAADREAGYRRGLEQTGFEPQVVRLEAGELKLEQVRRLLDDGITGLLIENDALALRWTALAESLGHLAPRDYSFAVLGDPISGRPDPRPWAAFLIPRFDMGAQAVRLLAQRLAGELPEPISLPCAWRPGDSLGPAPD